MQEVLLESQYAGSLAWWKAVVQAETVHIDLGSHYVKGTKRNKCYILSPNGILRLSVPLEKGKHQRRPMGEVRISYADNWQKNHWMGLCASYRRSAYFEYYEQDILPVFNTRYEYLHECNAGIFEVVCRMLKLEKTVVWEKNYIPPGSFAGIDLRDKVDTNVMLQPYPQVFSDRHPFVPNLSIWDLLFNLGPQGVNYLNT